MIYFKKKETKRSSFVLRVRTLKRETSILAQQEDGAYARINSSMLQSSDGKIVSLIGSISSFDGSNMTLKSADGGDVRVLVNDPNVEYTQVRVQNICPFHAFCLP